MTEPDISEEIAALRDRVLDLASEYAKRMCAYAHYRGDDEVPDELARLSQFKAETWSELVDTVDALAERVKP